MSECVSFFASVSMIKSWIGVISLAALKVFNIKLITETGEEREASMYIFSSW